MQLIRTDVSTTIDAQSRQTTPRPDKYHFRGVHEGQEFHFSYSIKDEMEIFKINDQLKIYLSNGCVVFRFIHAYGSYEDMLEDLISISGFMSDRLVNYLESNEDPAELAFLAMIFNIPHDKQEDITEFVDYLVENHEKHLTGSSKNFVRYLRSHPFYCQMKKIIAEFPDHGVQITFGDEREK